MKLIATGLTAALFLAANLAVAGVNPGAPGSQMSQSGAKIAAPKKDDKQESAEKEPAPKEKKAD
jgi:hypothetical protein